MNIVKPTLITAFNEC